MGGLEDQSRVLTSRTENLAFMYQSSDSRAEAAEYVGWSKIIRLGRTAYPLQQDCGKKMFGVAWGISPQSLSLKELGPPHAYFSYAAST